MFYFKVKVSTRKHFKKFRILWRCNLLQLNNLSLLMSTLLPTSRDTSAGSDLRLSLRNMRAH